MSDINHRPTTLIRANGIHNTLYAICGLLILVLITACTPQPTLANRVETALQAHFGESYTYTITPINAGEDTETVDILVEWFADGGPSTHGLELMVPEEADHAIWNVLEQGLSAGDFVRVSGVYFQRIEDR